MKTARYGHTATLLANGKVLVAGGGNDTNSYLTSAELFDPATGTWTPTGSLGTARYGHTATLLANGQVLVVEGAYLSDFAGSAELYDPATGVWSPTASLTNAPEGYTATLLANGKVLVAGGSYYDINVNSIVSTSAELYDPATGVWTTTGSLGAPRDDGHTATLLANGKVLVAGGLRQ